MEQKTTHREPFASTDRAAIKDEDYMAREKALAAAAHGRFLVFVMSASNDDADKERTLRLIKEMQRARERVMKSRSE
jgi:hypothetical protein